MITSGVHEYLAEIGRKGGKSRSTRKRKSSHINALKATKARMKQARAKKARTDSDRALKRGQEVVKKS